MPDPGLAPEILAMLVMAAFLAGFVDAIAGGGGLITVPALLIAGLPPVQAIATNKLQGTFGVLASAITFHRAGAIEPRLIRPLAGAAFAGGVAGAMGASLAPVDLLRFAIPFLLMGIAFFMLFAPKFGAEARKARCSVPVFAASAGLGIGLYDGAFGPGAGTFYLIGLIGLCGFPLARATAHTKLMNAASNLGALGFFLASGQVLLLPGLAMGAGAAAGSLIGARAGLKHGARLIRPLVIAVSIAMAMRLLLDTAHPLAAMIRAPLGF